MIVKLDGLVLQLCASDVFYCQDHTPRKWKKYALLLDRGLVKGYPWRIWEIIDTPRHVCHKRQHDGTWRDGPLYVTYPSQYPPPPQGVRGGPERMGPRPPPWVPLLKSYGSSILSTSLGSKTLNNTSLGLGETKI